MEEKIVTEEGLQRDVKRYITTNNKCSTVRNFKFKRRYVMDKFPCKKCIKFRQLKRVVQLSKAKFFS